MRTDEDELERAMTKIALDVKRGIIAHDQICPFLNHKRGIVSSHMYSDIYNARSAVTSAHAQA